jgi:hypothetical protein
VLRPPNEGGRRREDRGRVESFRFSPRTLELRGLPDSEHQFVLEDRLINELLDRMEQRWKAARSGPMAIASGHPEETVRERANAVTFAMEQLYNFMYQALLAYQNDPAGDSTRAITLIDTQRNVMRDAIEKLTEARHAPGSPED